MKTQFKINFGTDEIRTILLKSAMDGNAIPANVNANDLEMRVSPRTGVTFVPPADLSEPASVAAARDLGDE